MNQGKYIFAQLTDFLPRRVFDRIVDKYEGNKYVRFFICWNKMLCMVFGQLTARDSMRDLMLSLEAHQPKYYHLGFGSTVSRRNLGTANERRNYKIFEEFAYVLIEEAHRSCYRDDFKIEVYGNVYALDSTTIDLCLSIFWWAEFRKHKGGIKVHTLFDVKTSNSSFLHVTNAKVHDVNIMDIIPYETGSFYVADKGYTDFRRLYKIRNHGSFFVTRAKENLQWLKEQLNGLGVSLNEEKTQIVNMLNGESFGFLGFAIQRVLNRQRTDHFILMTPKKKSCKAIKAKIREIIKQGGASPAKEIIARINLALAGWVNYFRVGNSSHAFSEVRDYLEMKVRTLLTRRKWRQMCSVGWRRWSNEYLNDVLGLF